MSLIKVIGAFNRSIVVVCIFTWNIESLESDYPGVVANPTFLDFSNHGDHTAFALSVLDRRVIVISFCFSVF